METRKGEAMSDKLPPRVWIDWAYGWSKSDYHYKHARRDADKSRPKDTEYLSLREHEEALSLAEERGVQRGLLQAKKIALSEFAVAQSECRELAGDDESILAAQSLGEMDMARTIAQRIIEAQSARSSAGGEGEK